MTFTVMLQKILDGQYMEELETIKRRLDMKDPPTENRYRMNTRPAEAVQTSLTNLPGLDWAALTPSYRSGSYGGGSGYGGGSNASSNGQQQLVSGLQSMDLLSGVRPASSAQQLPPNLLPFDAQGASWLPMASSDARQRHALLPSAPKRRRPMAEQLPASQRPLYPAFDASPLSPIDFGFQDAAPSAPPLNGAAVRHVCHCAAACRMVFCAAFMPFTVGYNIDMPLCTAGKWAAAAAAFADGLFAGGGGAVAAARAGAAHSRPAAAGRQQRQAAAVAAAGAAGDAGGLPFLVSMPVCNSTPGLTCCLWAQRSLPGGLQW